jgi:predicted TPR repeat methyltransferase
LAWQKALEGEPEDRLGARPRLARLGIGVVESAVSDAYIRALFDDYANRFDSHLRGALAYSGPETIMAALDRLVPDARFTRVLDLGCGTGLMGAAIRARADWLGGCDLSPAMVTRAEAKAIYDALRAEALLTYLADQRADLVLAADVLVYIGDLAPVFAAVAGALPPDGLFAFTVQKGADGILLGEDLRYAHSPDRLRLWAIENGFEVVTLDDCATRLDRGVPVAGFVCILRKV